MQRPRAYWTSLPRTGSAADIAEAARRAEATGYRGVVGAQVYAPPWAPLAVAASATTTLEVASGIAMGFTRSTFETACAAIDLATLADGRFTLGLGTAPQDWTENYFGMPYTPPIGRMRDVVGVVRHVDAAARAGAPTVEPYRGRHVELRFDRFTPTFAPRTDPLPIWLASLRERLCELAGEVADGLIGHPVWSVDWTLGPALDALARGAARAGRDPDTVHLQLWLTVALDRNPARAVELARPTVAFYASIPQYRSFFEAHGFADVVDRIVEARRSQPIEEAARLVPDTMARTFVVCGDRDSVAATLDRLWERADSMMVRPPVWGVAPAEQAARRVELEALLLG